MGSGYLQLARVLRIDRSARWAAWMAVFGVALGGPSPKTVLQRAGDAVSRLSDQLPRVVATETSTQRSIPADCPRDAVVRQAVAELAWVTLPGHAEAIAFRDVIAVDGRPVAERARLVDLVHGENASWATALAILEQGARHNLAPGSRNFNLPTVALFFLHPERQRRFKWTRRSPTESPEWEIEFRERDRPTLIRTGNGRPIFSRGRVWIDVASGQIRQTRLDLEFDRIRYTLTTRFAYVAEVQLHVPATLDERFESPELVVTGQASYSNYRRFQTAGRLLP